jgi:hypothetical protein
MLVAVLVMLVVSHANAGNGPIESTRKGLESQLLVDPFGSILAAAAASSI